MAKPRDKAENLLPRLKALLTAIIDEKDNYTGEELDRLHDEFQEIFFNVARNKISEPYQLDILQISLAYFMTETVEPFDVPLEDAIDAGLRDAIADATSPLQTGLLALVRYLIEQQRRAVAEDLAYAESLPNG